MNNKQTLAPETLQALRKSGVLNKTEVAYIAGDLIVAEDIVTKITRVLGESTQVLNETSNRRLLKG